MVKGLLGLCLLLLVGCGYQYDVSCENGYKGRATRFQSDKDGTYIKTENGEKYKYSPGVRCSAKRIEN